MRWDGDDALPEEAHDDVVGELLRDRGALVPLDGAGLGLTVQGQRLDELANEPRQLDPHARRVLPLEDVAGVEGQVVADEHPGAEADAHRELPVMRVAQPADVFIAAIAATKRHETEVPHPVRGHCMVLFNNLVAIEAKAVPHQLHQLRMGNGNVGLGSVRRFESAEVVIGDFLPAGMRH